MRGAILMVIGVIFILISFSPFILDVIYPPEEYDRPISLVGTTTDYVEHLYWIEQYVETGEGNLYSIQVDSDFFTFGLIRDIYLNDANVYDILSDGEAHIFELDNTTPIQFKFLVKDRDRTCWITKYIEPKFHRIKLNFVPIPVEYRATGGILARATLNLENAHIYAMSPSIVSVSEGRFVIENLDENVFVPLSFDLQKVGNVVSGVIMAMGSQMSIRGICENIVMYIIPEQGKFGLNAFVTLDNDIVEETKISSIAISTDIENVEFFKQTKYDKTYYTIADIGAIFIEVNSEYWATKQSLGIIQHLLATIVVKSEEIPISEFVEFVTSKSGVIFTTMFICGLLMILFGIMIERTTKAIRGRF